MLGTIIKVINNKGYGFLIDERGTNRFFHFSSILYAAETINKGDVVLFKEDINDGNQIATELQKVSMYQNEVLRPGNYDKVLDYIENQESDNRQGIHFSSSINPVEKKQFLHFDRNLVTIQEMIIENRYNVDYHTLVESESYDMREISSIVCACFFHMPMPSIVLYVDKDGNPEILQGSKTLFALYSWLMDAFRIVDNPFREDMKGLRYSEIEATLGSSVKNYFDNLKMIIVCINGEVADSKHDELKEYYRFILE